MKDNSKLRSDVLKVIKYYARFSYAPSLREIHAYSKLKITRKVLEKELEKMIRDRIVVKKELKMPKFSIFEAGELPDNTARYTLGEYGINIKYQILKLKYSEAKIKKLKVFVMLLSSFPQIRLIGLSGSVAMLSANQGDDIDIFIISSKNRLWTARLLSVFVAKIIGRHRSKGETKVKDKICLNLFFDEGALRILPPKRSLYVAHEVLQMKPLFTRKNAYKRFLGANSWVFDMFPNAKQILSLKTNNLKPRLKTKNVLGDMVESWLKRVQLVRIKRTQTSEITSDTQLWFFPDDFEKKMKR